MTTALVWFRQDLRLTDNPALFHASLEHDDIIPIYILDDSVPKSLGAAQRWWLHHSLCALQTQLANQNIHLLLKCGNPELILKKLCHDYSVTHVYWNRCYEPYAIQRDTAIKYTLTELNIIVKSFKANLLFEPWEISTKQGGFFKVFSYFWKACCLKQPVINLLPKPKLHQKTKAASDSLNSFCLLPTKPNWASGFSNLWQPGEHFAQQRLEEFLAAKIQDYAHQRNFPAKISTSLLAPYLHFGEISPQQIWHATKLNELHVSHTTNSAEQFLTELGWREFAYHLLYHFPSLPEKNFRSEFDRFAWSTNLSYLKAWQTGQTGYPIVDAGMRELWHTGFMHNRVRMITASFLTKHLLIDWREGERWFWDTLLDADQANNAMNWQWVAGSGVDAAPYFRIFNPTLQSEKFDADGIYLRRWVPELAALPNKYIHSPWLTPVQTLKQHGITLGLTYPHPIVEHNNARKTALEIFKTLSVPTILHDAKR